MRRLVLLLVAIVAAALLGAWVAFMGRSSEPAGGGEVAGSTQAPNQPGESGRKITARLFYISQDGLRLAVVEREVPYAENPTEQARHIIEEQLKEPPAPYVAAIPPGTKLRGLYVTPRGDAFVDLSAEVSANHPGGSLDELFTVYSLVNALTANLPAILAVQILVEGREVETLAGHVDLRHPLQKNLRWVMGQDTSQQADR